MKSVSREILAKIENLYNNQFSYGATSQKARIEINILYVQLARWNFFCWWSIAVALTGAGGVWQFSRDYQGAFDKFLPFKAFVVVGFIMFSKWHLDIKKLKHSLMTIPTDNR